MSAHRKEFCVNGHPRTPGNVGKSRNCKVCVKERVAAFMAAHPGKYQEQSSKRQHGYRAKLANSYLNVLIHAKTGIPYDEITDEDREERRQIVLAYRARKEAKRNGLPNVQGKNGNS